MNIKKLYLIDPYYDYKKIEENNRSDGEDWLLCKKRLKKWKDKIKFIRKLSSDGLLEVFEQVDFVYIDGNHTYDYVYEDLEKSYLITKKGGYIIGDDFDFVHLDVVDAVMDFLDEYKGRVKIVDMWKYGFGWSTQFMIKKIR